MINSTRSCHEPFEFHLNYANNIPIFLYCLVCLGFGSLFGCLLWRHKQSRAHLARNFIMLINEDIFYFYLAMLFPGVAIGSWRTMVSPLPVYLCSLRRYCYVYCFFCICSLYQAVSIFKLCLIVQYERMMEYDQDKLKRVCYTGVTIVGGLIYSAFYFLNIYRGVFHQPEAYFAACTAEGFDYVIPLNITVFLLHLLVFMISNLIVRCYASQEEGWPFSWIQYVQCSISKTVTIGAFATTGFIWLILVVMTMPSMESNGGISLYFAIGAPLAGVLMHVLKEHEFTYPCLMAWLSQIKGFFCCKQNQVLPIQDSQNPQLPFIINVQPINPLEDDGGIYVG